MSCLLEILHYVFDYIGWCCLLWTIDSFIESFCPNNTVNEFFRLLADRADRESLILLPLNALITWCLTFHDAHTSHVVTIGSCIDQRLSKIEAKLVDVFTCFLIVKSVDDEIEIFKEMKAEPFFLDFAKMSIDFQMFVLALNLLFEYQRLWLINMFSSEQELAIQIADVNRVEINDSNLGETTQR